jgi:electron transfer flavoprotein
VARQGEGDELRIKCEIGRVVVDETHDATDGSMDGMVDFAMNGRVLETNQPLPIGSGKTCLRQDFLPQIAKTGMSTSTLSETLHINIRGQFYCINDFFSTFVSLFISIMFSTSRNTALRQINTQLGSACRSRPYSPSTMARFLSSLAILEQRNGALESSSLSSVAAAQKLGGSVTAFVAGSGAKSAAEQAAKVKGVEKILYIENSAYDRVCRRSEIPVCSFNCFAISLSFFMIVTKHP